MTSAGRGDQTTLASDLPGAAIGALETWGRLWGDLGLLRTVSISFSPRLRRSLGRANMSTGRITLHPALLAEPESLLLEVLCHEVAHVVAYRRAIVYGSRRVRAHGTEWAALVRSAGYEPRVRATRPWPSLTQLDRGTVPADCRVAHICPVCHARRIARRAVPGWRCAACVAVGLDGRLETVRLAVDAT